MFRIEIYQRAADYTVYLAHDLPQEVLNHEPVREEEPVAEIVLSHSFQAEFPSGTLP